ncbi:gamma-glutamylcyclotransferase [Burkholderia ubonensis]|uniref:gamma-glutamylcyclotransferase n=1 Tax=Burkholderia ubonensis TaxID=101571 RepID=UPI001160825C
MVPSPTYIATNKQPGLRPYHWYKQHVLAGAQEAHLPAGYIAAVERVESIEDTDSARVAREGGIYQDKIAQRG